MRTLYEKVETTAPRSHAWEVLKDFGGVAKWAPGMRSSRLEGPQSSGVGTHRVMRHAWGFRIHETITEWNEGTGYSFVLTRAPFPMHEVTEVWVLEPENNHAVITTAVSYRMKLGIIGALLDAVLVRFLVAREMRAGLIGFKNYVEQRLPDTPAKPSPPLAEPAAEKAVSGWGPR